MNKVIYGEKVPGCNTLSIASVINLIKKAAAIRDEDHKAEKMKYISKKALVGTQTTKSSEKPIVNMNNNSFWYTTFSLYPTACQRNMTESISLT